MTTTPPEGRRTLAPLPAMLSVGVSGAGKGPRRKRAGGIGGMKGHAWPGIDLWSDRRGVSAMEYALMTGLLMIMLMFGARTIGNAFFFAMVTIADYFP